MPLVLLILASGAIAGYLLRRFTFVRRTDSAIGIVIMLLLFFLGISVGSNHEVITKFRLIGTESLIIAFGGTVGSIIGGWIVYRHFFKKEDDRK